MFKMSEIKFDLVSTFGFKRDGGLNTHTFEGFHICAVSILIQLRTGFESLPLLSKVILTMNDNAWINLSSFLFSVTLLRTFNSSASMLRNTPQKHGSGKKYSPIFWFFWFREHRLPAVTLFLRRILNNFIDIDSINVFGVKYVNALRGPEAVPSKP